MPGKNKPKRLDRNRSWRVQRRKRKQRELVNGNPRNRKPRPKNKKALVAKVVEAVKKVVSPKAEVAVKKKVVKKVVKK